ncbi:Rv3235 family protein [Nocardia sp. NPDC051570]|uniref:Rv3235 family protein n=1 Tax=Nocardia sp. NPDC051570 TaxID=3364324 RepID=UPI0037BAC51E
MLSPAPNAEPPLENADRSDDSGRSRGPARRAPLPCHQRMPTRAGAHRLRGTHRRSPHDGRSPSYAGRDEISSGAIRFAERSLRLVLEAVDGRRSAAQLTRLVEPTVAATIETLVRTAAAERRLGAAVLVTVRAEPIAPGVAEVVAGYERGSRRFAIAARVARRRGEWRLMALRLR